jgi:hypothetical protein
MLKNIIKFMWFYYTSTRLYKFTTVIFIKISSILGFEISLSQFGEDLIIKSLISRESGVYVDVGCNRPILKNNTFLLYLKGYRGINIDGNNSYQSHWSKLRIGDKFISQIISNNTKEVDFHISNAGYVSSIDARYIEKSRYSYDSVEKRKPVTLTETLNMCGITNIDLLCIDVEGHDYEVLTSLDFNLFKPKLICIEDHLFNQNEPEKSEIYNFLNKHNYNLCANITPNLFFKYIK